MTAQTVYTFVKAQVSSGISTFIDFAITLLLKEGGGLGYLFSSATGSVMGGVVNFSLGSRWVFKPERGDHGERLLRYFLVWQGSILMNIGGVFLLTGFGQVNYLYAKVISALLVGVLFNYFLQRSFVFGNSYENRNNIIH